MGGGKKMIDKKYIMKLFPEIRKIRKKSLREGVIKAWLLAVERGNWQKIDKIPFTLLTKTQKTLVAHTRTVTRMAMTVARVRRDLNVDFVIAGGLVHDVGKLLEYERKGNKFRKSDYGKLVRHPVSGYAIALEAGLPKEVAHIVVAHSVEGENVKRSKEAIVINHCDFIDFDIEKSN
jgi:putative nucleotidyltransferase with HDIG domain